VRKNKTTKSSINCCQDHPNWFGHFFFRLTIDLGFPNNELITSIQHFKKFSELGSRPLDLLVNFN
jgi:hypothetical protein